MIPKRARRASAHYALPLHSLEPALIPEHRTQRRLWRRTTPLKSSGSSTSITTPSHEVPTLGLSTRRLKRALEGQRPSPIVSVYTRKLRLTGSDDHLRDAAVSLARERRLQTLGMQPLDFVRPGAGGIELGPANSRGPAGRKEVLGRSLRPPPSSSNRTTAKALSLGLG